jgi:hypothetical protein
MNPKVFLVILITGQASMAQRNYKRTKQRGKGSLTV